MNIKTVEHGFCAHLDFVQQYSSPYNTPRIPLIPKILGIEKFTREMLPKISRENREEIRLPDFCGWGKK